MPRFSIVVLASALIGAAAPWKPLPVVSYIVTVDSTRPDLIRVLLHIERAPSSLRLAMKVHAEYNAGLWHDVDSLTVRGTARDDAARATRVDSTLWQVTLPGGRGDIGYVVHLPPEPPGLRRAWRSIIRDDGAFLNPPDVLLYLPDFASAPAAITLRIPPSWSVATSLANLHAPNAAELLDAPLLLGHIKEWRFTLGDTTYHVDYWPLPTATVFDTIAFVGGLQRLSRTAVSLFGRLPLPNYRFQFVDGAGDALEHSASVTVGLQSAELARSPRAGLQEIAHEFFHTWNLVAIHPDHYGDLTYGRTPPTPDLWWSEGVTMHYADVLVRRAGLADSAFGSREQHLTNLLSRYYGAPWREHVSPEAASLAFGETMVTNPNATGGYYLQGELIGEALDAAIRDSTHEQRTLDDVLRALFARSRGGGFASRDLIAVVDSLCGCRMDAFFQGVVQRAGTIDLAPAMRRLGWRIVIDTIPSVDERGVPVADLRFNGATVDSSAVLVVTQSVGQWARAGVRTGDVVGEVNGAHPRSFPEFFRAVRTLRVGDSLTMQLRRGSTPVQIRMLVAGFDRPRARLVDRENIMGVERERRKRWLAGW